MSKTLSRPVSSTTRLGEPCSERSCRSPPAMRSSASASTITPRPVESMNCSSVRSAVTRGTPLGASVSSTTMSRSSGLVLLSSSPMRLSTHTSPRRSTSSLSGPASASIATPDLGRALAWTHAADTTTPERPSISVPSGGGERAGAAEVKPLAKRYADVLAHLPLLVALDALGHHLGPEALGEHDERRRQRPPPVVGVDLRHQRAVELDDVGGDGEHVPHRRHAAAGVV